MDNCIVVFSKTGTKNEIDELLKCFQEKKWDSYEIGGRCSNHLFSKSKHIWADILPVRDIDFDFMKNWYLDKINTFEDFKENSGLSKEYIELMYPDKDSYEYKEGRFATRCVVDSFGVWHEIEYPPNCSLKEKIERKEEFFEDYFKNFIGPAIFQNLYLAIVDIHI